MKRFALLSLLLAIGCGPATPPSSEPTPLTAEPAQPQPTMAGTPRQAPPGASTSPTPAPVSAPPEPSVPTVKLRTWTRSHDAPVRSLGIGKRRVAVLGSSAWMRDAGEWKEIALPEKLQPPAGAQDHARIYFGRDDRPRMMGIYAGDEIEAVYLRYKGGWRREPKEIGHLARKPEIPLFGILGHDDPEVVCKLGDQCIIKRLTGWTMVKAGEERFWVELSGGQAWGIGEHKLVRMTNDGWLVHGGRAPFTEPGGVWGDEEGRAWVSEPKRNQLHAYDGTQWTTHPSPVDQPSGLWGPTRDDVWLVGREGVAHYDGEVWSRVEGPSGPLREIRGAPDGVIWAAGESGTWMGVP